MPPDHEPPPEGASGCEQRGGDGTNIVEQQHSTRKVGNLGRTVSRRESADASLAIAFHVRQIFGQGYDRGIHRHEAREERDGRRPQKSEAESFARCIIHTKVKEETAACSNGDASSEREALQLERRHGVKCADRRAEGIQPKYEGIEECPNDRQPGCSRGQDQRPRGRRRDAARSNWQEGLVDHVDLDIVDLIDPHDEKIP
mmetsp:Transcript_76105/g.150861  ORF Transcript_76105/g.150861 Transcript_76105/m.150861 type:complete len:201 (-) Transcript_76105:439-1041(-)